MVLEVYLKEKLGIVWGEEEKFVFILLEKQYLGVEVFW